MEELIHYLTIVLLLIISISSIFNVVSLVAKGKISGYLFVILVFIVFYIIPTLVDTFFDVEFNNSYPEIQKSLNNIEVSIFYNIYISTILFFLIRCSKKGYVKSYENSYISVTRDNLNKFYNKYKILLWCGLLFPFFVTLFVGDLDYYSTYLARYTIIDIPESHSTIDKLVLIGVLFGVFILTSLFSSYRKNSSIIISHLVTIVLIIVVLYFWIHGKRSIVIIFFTAFLVLMIITKALAIRKILRLSLLTIISFFAFMTFYGKGTEGNIQEVYKFTRIDFGRDYGVKFAIHNDLILDRHIVPSKLSSFLFTSAFFIPREFWVEKPQPYAVYFTNSAFGNFGKDFQYGWGLTTSILAESISNLGTAGLFFGPFIIFYILRREKKSNNPTFKLLSILVSILLLLLQIIAFMPLFLLYIWFLYKENRKDKINKNLSVALST